jgi:hypothetical protein
MLPQRITLPSTHPAELNPFSTHSSGLFVHAKNLNPFEIKQIQTLSAKHPGWGYLCDNSGPSASLYPEPRRVRYHLPSFFSSLLFSYSYKLPPSSARFFPPLLSWSYELLFPQLLSFHNHLRCPLVFSLLGRIELLHSPNQVRRVGYPIAGHEPRVTGHVLLFRRAEREEILRAFDRVLQAA